mgnify:CR=1 FL=1
MLFYKIIGYTSRKNILLRKIFSKLGILRIIRKADFYSIIKLSSGEYFLVNPKDWIGFRCFISGCYDIEKKYEKCLMQIARQNEIKTFLDIGANHGYYSLKIASAFPNGRVYSFEPFSYNLEILNKNITLNSLENITVVNNVVSNIENKVKVYFSGKENSGETTAVRIEADQKISSYEEVESIVLDSWLMKENLKKIDLVKIDVEGFELNVLKGMKKILLRDKPFVFVEHNSKTLSKNSSSIEEIVNYMKAHNYLAYDISKGYLEPYVSGDKNLVLYVNECHKKQASFLR